MSEHSLAYYGNRVVRPPAEPRREALNRTISWGLVAVVHLVFLMMFTLSVIKQERAGRKGPVETILDLSLLHQDNAPPVTLVKPEVQPNAPPEISSAPIAIPPVKPIVPEQPPSAATPGDVLDAVRELLACGASSFEYLTDAQRSHCRRQPWIGRELSNGEIVMDLPPKAREEPQIHLSGADEMRHDMQTAPGCAMVMQTPCIDDIINGRGSKPF